MIEIAIILLIAFSYMDYQIKEKDKSIEGYLKWMKNKFYTKKPKDQE